MAAAAEMAAGAEMAVLAAVAAVPTDHHEYEPRERGVSDFVTFDIGKQMSAVTRAS